MSFKKYLLKKNYTIKIQHFVYFSFRILKIRQEETILLEYLIKITYNSALFTLYNVVFYLQKINFAV